MAMQAAEIARDQRFLPTVRWAGLPSVLPAVENLLARAFASANSDGRFPRHLHISHGFLIDKANDKPGPAGRLILHGLSPLIKICDVGHVEPARCGGPTYVVVWLHAWQK